MILPRAAVSVERIKEVVDTETTVVMPENGVTQLTESGSVLFENDSFSYPHACRWGVDSAWDVVPGEAARRRKGHELRPQRPMSKRAREGAASPRNIRVAPRS